MLSLRERQKNTLCTDDHLYLYFNMVKTQPGTACPLELTDEVRRQAEKINVKADLFLIAAASIARFQGPCRSSGWADAL